MASGRNIGIKIHSAVTLNVTPQGDRLTGGGGEGGDVFLGCHCCLGLHCSKDVISYV